MLAVATVMAARSRSRSRSHSRAPMSASICPVEDSKGRFSTAATISRMGEKEGEGRFWFLLLLLLLSLLPLEVAVDKLPIKDLSNDEDMLKNGSGVHEVDILLHDRAPAFVEPHGMHENASEVHQVNTIQDKAPAFVEPHGMQENGSEVHEVDILQDTALAFVELYGMYENVSDRGAQGGHPTGQGSGARAAHGGARHAGERVQGGRGGHPASWRDVVLLGGDDGELKEPVEEYDDWWKNDSWGDYALHEMLEDSHHDLLYGDDEPAPSASEIKEWLYGPPPSASEEKKWLYDDTTKRRTDDPLRDIIRDLRRGER